MDTESPPAGGAQSRPTPSAATSTELPKLQPNGNTQPSTKVGVGAAIALRDYQQDALRAIRAAYMTGTRRQLVVLPTGCGKTVVFAEVIRRRGGRAVVLAHRDELVRQAVEKIRTVAPGVDVGVVKAQRNEVDAQVIAASVQTLARGARLAQMPADVNVLVVDEAHHAAAATYRTVIDHIAGPNTLLLGVTATPDRADGHGLDSVFEEITYTKTLPEMVLSGYLADLRAVQIRLNAPLDDVRVRGGDYVDADVERLLMDSQGPSIVASAWRDHAQGRRGLVFTPTVLVAHAMADALRDVGVRAEAVDGTTPTDERRAILDRLHTGETEVVANCAVLTEGFDEPAVDCVVVARPTRSRALYVQMLGRGTRVYPGKDNCLVLDLVGSTTTHDLVTMAGLTGVSPKTLEQDTLSRVLTTERPAAPSADTWLADTVGTEVNLFRRRPMVWVRAGARYVLSLADGQVALEPHAGAWRVVEHRRDTRPVIVASGLTLEWAQGAGEDLVRQRGAELLARTDAPWRGRPASDKQLAALRRLRIPHQRGISRGEASELISAWSATRWSA